MEKEQTINFEGSFRTDGLAHLYFVCNKC